MQVNDILKNAYRLRIIAEANLENTLTQPATLEDWNGGSVENGGHARDINVITNTSVKLSNGAVRGAVVNKCISSGFSITRTLPEPLSGAGAAITAGTLTFILNDSSDEIDKRTFEDVNASLKVGGLINKGKTDEENLTYAQYETWLNARFVGYDKNEQTVDVSVGMKSQELTAVIPPNVHVSGDSQGLSKQLIFGEVFGESARAVGGGVHQVHDGPVDVTGHVINKLDYVCFKDGIKYAGTPIKGSGDGGGTAITSADYSWTAVDARTVTSALNTVKVPKGFTVTPSGATLSVAPAANALNTTTYARSYFKWQQNSTQNLTVANDPKLDVTLTGDVVINIINTHPAVPSPARASWFKIQADGTGTVTLTFDDVVKDLNLYIRAIRHPVQSISSITPAPKSIEPPFPTTYGPGANHLLKFRGINSRTVTFTYSSTDPAFLCSVWVDSVTLYAATTCTVELLLNPRIDDLDIAFGLANASQSITYGGTVIDSATPNHVFTGLQSNISLNALIGYGAFTMELVGGDREGNAYGSRGNGSGGYIFNPEPVSAGSAIAGISSTMKPFYSQDTAGGTQPRIYYQQFEITFKARIISGDTDAVRCGFICGSSPIAALLTVRENIQEFKFTRDVYDNDIISLPQGFSLFTWRGDASGKSWAATNADIAFEVEITDLCALPTTKAEVDPGFGNQNDIDVYILEGGARKELPTFRVADAREFKNVLSRGIAVYDAMGIVTTSPDYAQIFGRFVGEDRNETYAGALRKISKLPTGVDYITAALATDPRVGFVVRTRQPFINLIAALNNATDHYHRENDTTDGITVLHRHTLADPYNEFVIRPEDIIEGSYLRDDSAERAYQYLVEYQPDASDPDRTRKIESAIGYAGNTETTTIKSVLYDEAPNQALADTIFRESMRNDVANIQITEIGRGIREGMAGLIIHPQVPAGRRCIIISISETVKADSEIRYTQLKFKVLKGKGVNNG